MNKSRVEKYLKFAQQRRTQPIRHEEEVADSSDAKIDQDMPGFPHGPSGKDGIHPRTRTEQKTADPDLYGKHRSDSGQATDEERLK